MKERSHAKIRRQIQLAADGRLTPSQRQALDAHLAVCADCRAYAEELRVLETRLSSVSLTRLAPPKPHVAAQQAAAIQASYRTYTMKRQILSTAGALVTIAVVAVLIVLAGRIVPRQSSPATAPTVTAAIEMQTATPAADIPPFSVIEPAWLPEGYSYLNSKTIDNGQITCLYYFGRGDETQFPSLVIAQNRNGLPTIEQLRDPLYNELGLADTNIPLITETIQIGGAVGAQALFIESGMDPNRSAVVNEFLWTGL